MRLTKKRREQYLKDHGHYCPFCRSDNVQGTHWYENRVGETEGYAGCNDCEKQWVETYALVGVKEREI